MKHGGTGRGFVLGGISRKRSTTSNPPSASNSADLTFELAPATTTAPGGVWQETSELMGIDVNSYWVDGSVSNDVIVVSYDLKN